MIYRFKFASKFGYLSEEAETPEEAYDKLIKNHDKYLFTDPITNFEILEKRPFKKLINDDIYSPIYSKSEIREKNLDLSPEIIEKLKELQIVITNHARQRLIERFREKIFLDDEIINTIRKSKNTNVETISGLELWRYENFVFFLDPVGNQNCIPICLRLVTVIPYRYYFNFNRESNSNKLVNVGIGKDINNALIHGSHDSYIRCKNPRNNLCDVLIKTSSSNENVSNELRICEKEEIPCQNSRI